MHKQRIVLVTFAAIGLTSCFLPWTGGDLTGIDISGNQFWWGWLSILLFLSILVIAFSGKRNSTISTGAQRIAVFVASGFIVLETLALILIMAVFPFGTAQYGLYLALLTGLALLVVPPFVDKQGNFTARSGSDLLDEFGSNADKMEKQIDHFSEKVREDQDRADR